jgi:hypothetical protein
VTPVVPLSVLVSNLCREAFGCDCREWVLLSLVRVTNALHVCATAWHRRGQWLDVAIDPRETMYY